MQASSNVAMVPATNEPIAAVASAARAAAALGHLVAFERGHRSKRDSPGVFSRIEVVEPPYMPP